MLNVVGKVLCEILNASSRRELEQQRILSEEQNTFRADKRVEDNLYCLKDVVERCRDPEEKQQKVNKHIYVFWILKRPTIG